jgi:hypothetical protein
MTSGMPNAIREPTVNEVCLEILEGATEVGFFLEVEGLAATSDLLLTFLITSCLFFSSFWRRTNQNALEHSVTKYVSFSREASSSERARLKNLVMRNWLTAISSSSC